MSKLNPQELVRAQLQDVVDSEKTLVERNKLGQFATPRDLAWDILSYAKSALGTKVKVDFLDPAFGTGVFYSALQSIFPPEQISRARGYEIDPLVGDRTKELWSDHRLELDIADFTKVVPPINDDERANLLICNPPYVRHHHITGDEKLRLKAAAQDRLGLKLSGLSGLYCYFIWLTHDWLADGGLAGWLVPSEFMDVNYGQAVKAYLLDQVTLLHVHRFDPDGLQFDDALVSSTVVWFWKSPPPKKHKVRFTFGGSLDAPDLTRLIPTSTLRSARKWTKYPATSPNAEEPDNGQTLSDLFETKRGLATGANDYFILSEERASELNLPDDFLIPILPSPRYMAIDEIEADDVGNPMLERRLFLLSCDLHEEEIESQHPHLWRYLQEGMEAGIHQRYLCKHRNPWYMQEKRPSPKLLCTYMGRRGGNGRPFRFILNGSNATAANSYLLLYPKPVLADALEENPALIRDIWKALNNLSVETMTGEGRVYGGGLHKLEPAELGLIPAELILDVLPSQLWVSRLF